VNECEDTTTCPAYATCTDTVDSYYFTCKQGFQSSNGQTNFKGPGVECQDVDDCLQIDSPCGPNSVCKNLPGRSQCSCISACKLGVNECEDTTTCPAYATCTNTVDSYYFTCKQGFQSSNGQTNFKGPRVECQDVDECSRNSTLCGPTLICINTLGSYSCSCPSGFSSSVSQIPGHLEDVNCTDIDECIQDPSRCGHNSACTNVPGSYICGCLPNFRPDPEGSQAYGNFSCKRYDPVGELHRAASVGDVASVERLINGSEHHVNESDRRGRTALHYSCAHNHPAVVMLLATQRDNVECVSILLMHGADPHIIDFTGDAALHHAVCRGNTEIASKLLDHKANIDAETEYGLTPYKLALFEKQHGMAEFLIKNGAKVHLERNQNRHSENPAIPSSLADDKGNTSAIKDEQSNLDSIRPEPPEDGILPQPPTENEMKTTSGEPTGPRRIPPPKPSRNKRQAPHKPPLSPPLKRRNNIPGPPRPLSPPLPPCVPARPPHQVHA
ncbi:Adhesion G protein-coupled receptor E1, partial [Lemmus lemmus]